MSNRETDRKRIKAFLKFLVDRMSKEAWEIRRAALVKRITQQESSIDLSLPIEPQLFTPPQDDIDWYLLVADLAYDHPFSDSAYSSTRIYPYAMTIGAYSDLLQKIPNVEDVLKKMLANNSKPETQIFELLTATHYLKNGYKVEFIPENSITWPDGITKRSPDLLVKSGDIEMYVECKRADKQTKYSQSEVDSWNTIWSELSAHMLKVAPWSIIDVTFHGQVTDASIDDLISSVDTLVKQGGGKVSVGSTTTELLRINKTQLHKHYQENAVRPNSPQHEILVFGRADSNEKRSIATIAKSIVRPGTSEDFLNIYVESVGNCVAAQWRCDHELSVERRSRHFKGLISNAIKQFPPHKLGIVHVWYETVEGINIEELRQEKHISEISEFNADGTLVLGVLIHGVNYYPNEGNYDWAETVQDFARIPDLMRLYRQALMLSADKINEIEDTTHWAQDKATKLNTP
ncbi:UNVERIFIED_CONTAM: hypothetical protein NO986_20525 [Comamonas sp. A-3]